MPSKFNYETNTFGPFQVSKGLLDFAPNWNGFSAIVANTVTTPLVNGDPVVNIQTDSGIRIVRKALDTDTYIDGFIRWSTKRNTYPAGFALEYSKADDIMWMESSEAITAGSPVYMTDFTNVLVGAAENAHFIGFADSGVTSANQMVRVHLKTPHLAAGGA